MIAAARIGAGPRAVRLAGLILLAALVRSRLEPVGEGVATAAFAALLLLTVTPSTSTGERWGGGVRPGTWGTRRSILSGLAVAALLVAPGLVQPGGRAGYAAGGLAGWWPWAATTALVASLEEVAIRGALYDACCKAAGPPFAIAAGAAVFALIHLPRYGVASLPLDLAVGIALGALRVLCGRVLPCAVAHTVADWAAWWMP